MRTQYDSADVQRVIDSLVAQICATFAAGKPLGIIGIRTRGEILAQRITRLLQQKHFNHIERGVLDITLYRDDLSEIGPKPLVRPTAVDFDLSQKPILLVDDVLFTGRSIRAALSALSDFGRPSMIKLLVLADRGGRELPIQADFTGLTLQDIPPDYRVNVRLKEVDEIDEIVVEPKG